MFEDETFQPIRAARRKNTDRVVSGSESFLMTLTPSATYIALLVVQTAHLLHHRLAKRHISFAEVASSAILCIPLTLALPAWLYNTAHLVMIAVQVVGSIWIRRLSPAWTTR